MQYWLYYRIYPGHSQKMDLLISTVLGPAVLAMGAKPAAERWFFIRYVDYRGPHLRVRFRGAGAALRRLHAYMEGLLREHFPRLQGTAIPEARRLLSTAAAAESPGEVAYQLDLYEPEEEKYGGPKGVDIAEQLFQASSQLSLDAIATNQPGTGDLTTLALVLMEAAAAVAVPQPSRRHFWDHYAWFWSGGNQPGAEARRRQLRHAAEKRAGLVAARSLAILSESLTRGRAEAYRQALTEALSQLQSAAIPIPAPQLYFHYIHLMNNRLGMIPAEEAYLAYLVQHLEGAC